MEINLEFLKRRPLSKTSLSQFALSPRHYIHYLTAPRETTDAFTFGNLVDCLVFEPNEYQNRFTIMPEFGRTNDEKDNKKAWMEANKGKSFIKQAQLNDAMRIQTELFKHAEASRWLKACKKVQERIYWEDQETGLPIVGILDGAGNLDGTDFILDLKTAASGESGDFSRAAFNFNYHLQTAMYLEGYEKTRFKYPSFYNVVIEKDAPFATNVLKSDKDYIKLGKQQFHELLMKFSYCMKENLWHQGYEFGTAFGYNTLYLPGYAKQLIKP